MTRTAEERRLAQRDASRRYRAKPGVKEAQRDRQRARREDPEYRKEEARRALERVLSSPTAWASRVLASVRLRAKQRGHEFAITADDIPVPEFCPVLGIPLVVVTGKSALQEPNSPSIDRIDNSLGYVPGNVRVISMRANLLKKDATLEELKALVEYLEREISN